MARIDQRDFDLLKSYVDDYSLRSTLASAGFSELLKHLHRRHLLVILVSAQASHLRLMKAAEKGGGVEFEEVVSDLTEAFFCAINGSYKAAYTLLRSSIENYLRVVARDSDEGIMTLTSVYQLFDRAELVPYFQTEAGALCFRSLKQSYSSLCKFVHSSVKARDSSFSALCMFPVFDGPAAESFKLLYERVSISMVDALVNEHPRIYLEMHFTGQDLLSDLLPRRTMRVVHGVARYSV